MSYIRAPIELMYAKLRVFRHLLDVLIQGLIFLAGLLTQILPGSPAFTGLTTCRFTIIQIIIETITLVNTNSTDKTSIPHLYASNHFAVIIPRPRLSFGRICVNSSTCSVSNQRCVVRGIAHSGVNRCCSLPSHASVGLARGTPVPRPLWLVRNGA